MTNSVTIIGAGLAGSEAAYQLAKRGVNVKLYEMKPKKFSPAHKMEGFAELVCSNSLKAKDVTTSSGLLKKEMELLDSLIIKTAYECSTPAGGALAVDREKFSEKITKTIKSFSNIEIINEELDYIPTDTQKKVVIDAGSNQANPITTQSMTAMESELLVWPENEENIRWKDGIYVESGQEKTLIGQKNISYISFVLICKYYILI